MLIAFSTYMSTSMPEFGDKELHNIMTFLTDIPADTAALFVAHIDSIDRESKSFIYMSRIHVNLFKKYPKYKEKFYDQLLKRVS